MGHHEVDIGVELTCADVLAVIGSRPSTWLRPFLRLAAPGATGTSAGQRSRYPWFRLGGPAPVGDATVFRFIWWPHVERAEVFARFEGTLRVSPQARGTRLGLSGVSDGGQDAVSEATLSRLLALVASAISAG